MSPARKRRPRKVRGAGDTPALQQPTEYQILTVTGDERAAVQMSAAHTTGWIVGAPILFYAVPVTGEAVWKIPMWRFL